MTWPTAPDNVKSLGLETLVMEHQAYNRCGIPKKFPIVSTEICSVLMGTFLSVCMEVLLQLRRTILFFR